MSRFTEPHDYARVKCVSTFEQLVETPFADGVNALCWQRELPGDFGQIVALLGGDAGVELLTDEQLLALRVSPKGQLAVAALLADQQLLRELGAEPILNLVRTYPRDTEAAPVATDVYSFHVDSSPVEVDTWLCTYHGAPSQILRNDQAQRRVDVAETRGHLLRRFGGPDGKDFEVFLTEHCYDLHYAALPAAQPIHLGFGNLWRLAVAHPSSRVPACIHRAPEDQQGLPARLLLIA